MFLLQQSFVEWVRLHSLLLLQLAPRQRRSAVDRFKDLLAHEDSFVVLGLDFLALLVDFVGDVFSV